MSGARRHPAWWILVAFLLIATLATTSLGVWKLLEEDAAPPPPVADSADFRREVTEAAAAAAVTLLSYNADTVSRDVAAAAEVTTGEFRDYYREFTREVVVPAAKEKAVTTTATVPQAGVISVTADEADVLVFVNQNTTSRDTPDGAEAASSVRMGMKRVDGAWLVDSFDPV